MKTFRKICAVACIVMLVTAVKAQTYEYESVPGDLTATRIYTLENGLKVYLSVNKEKPRITAHIAVRTGSRNDPAETTGLAHYLEHLMFKGTKVNGTWDAEKEAPYLDEIEAKYEVYRTLKDPEERRACYREIDSLSQLAAYYNIPNEYDKMMAAIGSIGSNAYTDNDVTCYVEDIPSNELETWAEIQSDRFQNMVIRGFHTELEAVYEEYNIGIGSDRSKTWEALSKKMFPTHPYGTQSTIGTQDHLKNPSIVNIKNYFKRYYVPNNVAICMSGDLDPEQTIAIIDKYFGSWKANDDLSYPTYDPVTDLTAPVDTTVTGLESANIMLGWKFGEGRSLQIDTLEVVAEMLSNGKAGLFDIDVNQAMKCQAAFAFPNTMSDYSQLVLYGIPNEGQSLDDVRATLLAEVAKLRSGDYDDDLLPSVVNNIRLNYYRSLDNNRARVTEQVNAFIFGKEWSDVANKLNSIAGITKEQITDFANKYLGDNYVAVYKEEGVDTTLKKIDKPQITPIPANRDKQSAYLAYIANKEVEPIAPQFLDFSTALTKTTTESGLPLYCVKDTTDELFELTFRYDVGEEANKWLAYSADYLSYIGTDDLTAAEIQKKFYSLACDYEIKVGPKTVQVKLSGLNHNIVEAVDLLEHVLTNPKADAESYALWTAMELKARNDDKLDQRKNFAALFDYGVYGPYNPTTNIPSEEELAAMNPQTLAEMIGSLKQYPNIVLYYGMLEPDQVGAVIDVEHSKPDAFEPVPESKEYVEQPTPAQTTILVAPYEAKNIYMRQIYNGGDAWDVSLQAVADVFNQYFGTGTNNLVYQELREVRGLAYNAKAYYITPQYRSHAPYFYTHIISQNDKMMDCIATFASLVDEMPLSETLFSLAKQSVAKRLASSRTTKGRIFDAYFRALDMGIDYDINEQVYNALPTLTLEDMSEFEKTYVANKPYLFVILGDENDIDIEGLKQIAPVEIVPTATIFGY